jgi:hypothetical protein
MKRKKPPKNLQLEQPSFRLRAITLALLAFAAGVLALVLVLTPPPPPTFYEERSNSPPEEWPPGFVELDRVDWAALPRSSSAASAHPSAPRIPPTQPSSSADRRSVASPR